MQNLNSIVKYVQIYFSSIACGKHNHKKSCKIWMRDFGIHSATTKNSCRSALSPIYIDLLPQVSVFGDLHTVCLSTRVR